MAVCISVNTSRAQHQQLWFDYQLDYPFANLFLFELPISYQTVLVDENKWWNINVSPTLEYGLFNRLDLIFTTPIAYTIQTEENNSFEVNPTLGAKFYVTQNKRIDTRLIFKVEERFFRNLEEGTWSSSNRLRLKGEMWISINRPNHYQDKLWYTILDYEEFLVTDEQLDERFANLRRGRIGIGYRHNYKNRFELIYTLQSSRNEIQGEFTSTDNVLQLRYKMFINPSTTQTSETKTNDDK